MSNNETSDFLEKDIDNYVNNFNDLDLYARHVNSKNEYLEIIKKSSLNFNENQKFKLIKSSKNADNFLKNYQEDFINGINIKNIKWIFALTNDNYEEGMPHTRKNIIFLSNEIINNYQEDKLTKLLIHEKIHIYQRNNNMEMFLYKNGFKFSRKRNIIYNARSNPDLDDNIYKDYNGNELIALYKSDKPNGLNDVNITDFSKEHPYEKMAYEISELYSTL
jgi:hypothetical protein